MKKISLLKNQFDKSEGLIISPFEFVKRIKTGEWKLQIEKIRASTNEKQQKVLKGKLPAVTLAGIVKARKLLQPSGYIGIDIDAHSNKKLVSTIPLVRKDKYVAGVWKSSRGKGYWLLFRINPKQHAEAFEGIKEYLKEKYSLTVDGQCKDPARLCYVSYDEDANFKYDVPVFKEYSKKKKKEFQPVTTPRLDELQYITQCVVEAKKDITNDYQKWFNTGVLYAECGEAARGLYHNVSEFHGLYNKQETDLQFDNCLKFVAEHSNDKARQKLTFKTLYGYLKTARIKCLVYKPSIVPGVVVDGKQMTQIETYLYKWKLWEFVLSKSGFKCRGLNPDGVGEFLHKQGIRVYGGGGKREYFHISNNVVKMIDINYVGNMVIQETVKLPKDIAVCFDNVKDSVSRDAILSESQRTAKKVVEGIYPKTFDPTDKKQFLRDTEDRVYLKYSDTVVSITAKGIKKIPYNSIPGLVWEKSVKQFPFAISNDVGKVEQIFNKAIGEKNKDAYMSSVGFMICNYFPPAGTPILFCCDLDLTEGLNNGGNGKDFIKQVLAQVREVVTIPARNLDLKKEFALSWANHDTEVIWFEDLNRSVYMDQFYNFSNGMPIRRLHSQPFSVNAKIGVSLQHTIDMEGNSNKRRQIFLLFQDYFAQLPNGIASEFGQVFSETWENSEREKFNGFVVRCVQCFLKKGIVRMDLTPLIEVRKEHLGGAMFQQLKLGQRYETVEAMEYLQRIGCDLDGLNKFSFTLKWRQWCEHVGYTLEMERNLHARYYTMKVKTNLKLHKGGKAV